MDARAAERRRRMTVRKFASHAEADAADLAFWRAASPEERLEAVCDLVLEFSLMQGQGSDQLRLQRSVCRVERRRVEKPALTDGWPALKPWATRVRLRLDQS
jgi:hypothetical protein